MDVKNMAAMFGAKKADPPPLRKQTTGGKIAVAGIFSGGQNNKTEIKQTVTKVEDKEKESAQGASMSENKFKENPFMKKTTVNLDQDKSKFVSSQAKEDNQTIVNPFVKNNTTTEKKISPFEQAQLKKKAEEAEKAAQKPAPMEKKMNPFELAQQKKKEEEAQKAAEKPKPTEKKMNPFELAQQKKKEEEAQKAAEKPKPTEKKMNPFELAQQKKKEEVAQKAAEKPAPVQKKMNPFELAQQKRKEEAEAKAKALAEEKAKNGPKKLDPSQMIQIPTQRKAAPEIFVRQSTMVEGEEEQKKDDFAEKQKNLAALLARGPAKKPKKTEAEKLKIKAKLFSDGTESDDDDLQKSKSALPHTSHLNCGLDCEDLTNKPAFQRDRRPSQRYKMSNFSDSD